MAEGEKFDPLKFMKGMDFLSPVLWAKTASHTLRVAIIVGLITLGYGYYKGRQNRPINVNTEDAVIKVVNGDGKTHEIRFRNHQMYFDEKLVKTKDIPSLKPFGIEVRPKLAAGVTTAGNPAVGLALEVAHAYNFNLDLLAMMPFIGAGISYDIHLEKPFRIDNTSVGIGVGRDLEVNENAAIIYMAIEF